MRIIPSNFARSALDFAPDAMVIVNAAGTILFTNRQVSVLFGYARDEITGKNVEMLIPERFRARHVGHREHYTGNERARPMGAGLELFGRRKNGTEFPVEISLSPIEDDSWTLVAAAIRDVTDRKRIETELLLAREAAEAARELANKANRSKSRFLAMASHDLRQPLQTIELLNGSMREATGDDVVTSLSEQKQAISAMSRLLNALLDISKIESGAIIPEPTDFPVAAIFDELRMEFASIADSKGLQLAIESCNETAYGDPSLVQQILRNLVSNAVKYTRDGSVRLCCLHEAGSIRIQVLDTGVGIPPDQLSHIYDEFYQVGIPTNISRDGYGLGLSIVQRLVKLLAVKLEVHSEVGKGSAFSLLLPASHSHDIRTDRASMTPAPGPRQAGEARVLLVEDNTSLRLALRRLLTLKGYHVTAVESLMEAMQHVQDGHCIDLLICDYHLKDGETGSEVVARLRQMVGAPLRALIITGDTSSAMKELPHDPNLRIASKPIDSEELVTLVRSLLAAVRLPAKAR
jgi:two-component system, sensor histidine kinase